MKLFRNIPLIIVILAFTGNVYAGTAATKLGNLADSLIKVYASKAATSKATLAIFPFNCDEKLDKRRVGFAASEVMSHRFVSSQAFTVVERAELNRLLTEQKLQSSGAVESETAVRLGKILGANVILVGNIQKVGGKYQINARLVNAETAEVLSSGYEELNANAFEEDARVYLNLVPEVQTLGVYLTYNHRNNPNKIPNYAEYNQTFSAKSFSTGFIGGGFIYKPLKNLFIDVGGSTLGNKAKFSTPVISAFNNARVDALYFGGGYTSSLSGLIYFRGEVGIQKLTFAFNGASEKDSTGSTLFLKGGVEYKPQSRLGIGFSAKYDLTKIKAVSKYGHDLFELNQFSLEPSIAFYF